MITVKRFEDNPILLPNKKNNWEAEAVFNGSCIKERGIFHLVYRAMSIAFDYFGQNLKLSTIGHAQSTNGIHFDNRKQLIKPEYEWEKYGCEDPRITKIDGKFYITYTALSNYPPNPDGIKIAVAKTQDFEHIEEKHRVTTFNSKAMAFFPERIQGKIASVLTVHTDLPPAKICLSLFDYESQIWSEEYWKSWYADLDSHLIPLQRTLNDHIEVGAPPVKTSKGWIFIYCYIENYFTPPSTFRIEAALLDFTDPRKIIRRTTQDPILVPEKHYELYGDVPNIVFPSGALIQHNKLYLYYGAADTTCCLAIIELDDLLDELYEKKHTDYLEADTNQIRFEKYEGNPIIQPNPEHDWKSKYTCNPAAIYESGKVHLVFRAAGEADTSVLGYASSHDGLHVDEILDEPIYSPRENFEQKAQAGNSGCEDPRITKLGHKLYMCYTAFDALNPTRVALTSINIDDFLAKKWSWEKPVLISPPDVNDKNSCIFPDKVNNKYVFLHRIGTSIWIDYINDLNFDGNRWLGGEILFGPRKDSWDSEKVGTAGPPIKTLDGWLLIYHGLSTQDNKYRLGAALLELNNPSNVLSRLDYPVLEPDVEYENTGLRPGTVFACGSVLISGKVYVYYGGADQVVCVAYCDLDKIIQKLKDNIS